MSFYKMRRYGFVICISVAFFVYVMGLKQLMSRDKSHLPSAAMAAYEGSVVKLPCMGKSTINTVTWTQAASLNDTTFTPLEDKDTVVEERDGLMIYNVDRSDAGVYRCQTGDDSRLILLEVVEDDYNVVKPRTSHGPYATPPRTLGDAGLTVASAWTPWSECSTCGAVGRRRRYGMCHVIPNHRHTAGDSEGQFQKADMKIFEEFPGGLPCRSEYLPDSIRSMPEVKQRLNEIMIGLCKVSCKTEEKDPFDVFLTEQPRVVRDIVFAKAGQTVKLRCPGAIYRDAPCTWRVDGALVSARALCTDSGGRAHLDARGRLVLAPSATTDSRVYSCGAYGQTAGYIVLVVK